MPPRAAPMAPDARRDALIEATLPLLREHGRAVSTRQIARAAGVAEGTIFRVFDSKDDLVEATLIRALDPMPFLVRVGGIDPDQPLRAKLIDLVRIMQQRYTSIFDLMRAVGMVAPPERWTSASGRQWRTRADAQFVDLVGADHALLRIPVLDFSRRVRLLAFAGSHSEIADGAVLTPEEIVDTLLFGLLTEEGITACCSA